MLVRWVHTQRFVHNTRSFLACAGEKKVPPDNNKNEKKLLNFSPWEGTFFFFYKNHLLWYQSRCKEMSFCLTEEVSISCFGIPEVLKELFNEYRREYLKLVRNKTSIFEPQNGSWKRVMTRTIRPIATVIMDEEEKAGLLSDIKAFLDPRTRSWYTQKDMLYKKGYLLYGPPGTGKSSLSLSIAGCFNLEIYMIHLSSLDERSLSGLFGKLPPHCVVLLEDVDALDTTQTRQGERKNVDQEQGSGAERRVSLSGLLNTLDGVASQEGQVLIMTTNHIERLDPTLIRPGQVDKQIEFGLANKDTAAHIFSIIYDDIPTGEKAECDAEVAKLARDFADKMPKQEFSPAEIMSLLVENRHSPCEAMENMQPWITRTREERAKRTDSWVVSA